MTAISQLPLLNHDIFELLCRHLKSVTQYEGQNKMNSQNLAIVMGPTLIRARTESPDPMMIVTDNERKCNIMRICIESVDVCFSGGRNPQAPMQNQPPARPSQPPPRPAPQPGGNLMGEMALRMSQRPPGARGAPMPPPTGNRPNLGAPPMGAPPPMQSAPPMGLQPGNPMAGMNPMGTSMRPVSMAIPQPQPNQPQLAQSQRPVPPAMAGQPMRMGMIPVGGMQLRKGRSETDVLNRKQPTPAAGHYGKLPLNDHFAEESTTHDDMSLPDHPTSTPAPHGAEQYGSVSAILNTRVSQQISPQLVPQMPQPQPLKPAVVGRPPAQPTRGLQPAPGRAPMPSRTPPPAVTLSSASEQYGNLSMVKAPTPTPQQEEQPAPPSEYAYDTSVEQPIDYEEMMAMYGTGMDPSVYAAMQASLGDNDSFLQQYKPDDRQPTPEPAPAPTPLDPSTVVEFILANGASDEYLAQLKELLRKGKIPFCIGI